MASTTTRVSVAALRKRGTPPGTIYLGGLVSMTFAERDALLDAVEAARAFGSDASTPCVDHHFCPGCTLNAALARLDFEDDA